MLYRIVHFLRAYPNLAISYAGLAIMLIPVAIGMTMWGVYDEFDRATFSTSGPALPVLLWASDWFGTFGLVFCVIGVAVILFGIARQIRQSRKSASLGTPPAPAPDAPPETQ